MPYSDPDRQRAYKRDWARMGRAGECGTPSGTPLPASFRLQTAQDVIDLLQEQAEAVRSDKDAGALEKARCIAYVAGVALKAIETGNLAARLEALELTLKQRKDQQP